MHGLTGFLDLIPEDSRVEIDAKINAGYFTTGKQFTEAELKQVKGRGWEKWEDVVVRDTFRWAKLREQMTDNKRSTKQLRIHIMSSVDNQDVE